MERHGFERFRARLNLLFALIVPWTRHLRTGIELLRRSFEFANAAGELRSAGYSCMDLISYLLAIGDPLPDVEREAEQCLEFCRKTHFNLVIDVITTQLALIRTLRGHTTTFGGFNQSPFDEPSFERRITGDGAVPSVACWYWIRKMQARFMAADYGSAVEAALNAQRLLWTSPSFFESAEAHFYGALSHAACCDAAVPEEYRQRLQALTAHHRQLGEWAENCRENFENRALLVGAEIARIEGRELDAERLYEAAIQSARENEFVQNEALANELAARFYAGRGFERIARAYLRDARDGYRQWGADGKVRQLEAQHPYLSDEHPSSDPTRTVLTSVEHLDLSTVLKLSQTVQGETDLEKLIAAIMRLGVEHAGAERGLLLLPDGDTYRIEAEASSGNEQVTVDLRKRTIGAGDLPQSVLRFVLRTRERVLLQDAAAATDFADDQYLRRHHACSVLCIPLLKQTRLAGIIYLENNLTSGAFTPARMAVLEVLASDAAISLENARLYRDLQEREARVRRLIDANIIGVFTWHADGRLFDVNDEFLRIIGYSREDFVSSGLRWTDFTLQEWRQRDLLALEELREGGRLSSEEREYLRKDGTRVPVLTGGTMFGGTPDQGVAFVIDVTERKRAELALRESEREARLIVETIPGLVAVMTPAGEVEHVNRQVLEYFGRTPEELKQWGTIDAVHPADVPGVIAAWQHAIETGQPYDLEHRIRRADGQYRWFQLRGLPLRDAGGHVIHWYVLLTDIDARKQAELELSALKDRLYKENLVLRDEVDRTFDVRGDRRDISGAAAGAGPGGEGRAHRLHRTHHRRDRHWQGARCPRDPSSVGTCVPSVRKRQLRGDSA
jgi:PAS domain S-box-containing protein